MERVDRETIRALPFFGEDTRRASCSRPPRWSAARGRSPSRGRGRTTGAGDLYASGFLYGYTQGMALDRCGHLGSIAASAVIGHTGARPGLSLAQLLHLVGA